MNRSRNRVAFWILSALILSFSLVAVPTRADAQIGCHQCHGSKNPPDVRPVDASFRNASSGGFPGNHRTHLGAGSTTPDSCTRCHGNSGYTSGHRDGIIQIVDNINNSGHPDKARYFKNGSSPVFFNQTTHPTLGSCTNVNCHFESATPVWGSPSFTAPDDCGRCHSANPTTGSHPATGGKHAPFPCASCHGDHATFNHATSVRLKVQFSPVPGGRYTGDLTKFLPSQSAGKTYGECRNIYCHSDGTAAANGVIGRSGNLYGNYTTPVWGGSLTNNCRSCHDYPPDYGQAYYIKMSDPVWASWAGPKANLHGIGWHYDEPCSSCHHDTTVDGTTISNPSKHANGVYDVAPGPGIGFRYDYDPAGGTCSTVYCHGWYAHPHDEMPWGDSPYLMNVPYPAKTACRTYNFTVNESEFYLDTSWHWPDLPPITTHWDFGDGTSANNTFAVSHKYEQPGIYVVKFTARDKIQHLTYGQNTLIVDNKNIKPIINVTPSVDGMTVTLTDLSRDPDYNDCGNSGSGMVYIDWNDGNAPFSQSIQLTDSPSNITFQHLYQNPGTYNISYTIKDNAGEYQYLPIPRLTVQVPSGTTLPLSTFKGHVTDHVTGLGLPGVTVQVKNPQVIPSVVGTTTTDDSGYYEFTNFPLDITYSIEVSKEGRLFNPSAKSAWISSANAGQVAINDFHTSAPDSEPKINIGGLVTDGNGNGVMAFLSLLKGDVVVRTTETTRTTGVYTFGDVDDDCYTVKASYDVGNVYTPETREVCFSDNGVNFTQRTVNLIQQVSGTVIDGSGEGISSVTVNLKDSNGKIVAAGGTGTGSIYSISGRAVEGCYTLEPKKYGYTFVPAYRSICGTGGESIINQNFAGQPTAPLISISGRITADDNGSLYYPAMYLKKDGQTIYKAPSKAYTGGYYEFAFEKVPGGGCYTVEPADERYAFTPASREVCDSSSSVDFSSVARETMNLGGEIYNRDGIPVRYPVTVNIRDSWGRLLTSPVTYVTYEDYHYLGKYMTTVRKECVTLEPVAGTFTFTPAVQAVCQATSNVDFKATDTRFRVKGRVMDQGGAGLENVTLYLQDANGKVVQTRQTINGGYYSFGKLANACYTVVPAAGNYPYSPLSVSVCGENTNANFTQITASSGTVATPVDSTAINVTWLDSEDETGVTVERCSGTDCTEFSALDTLGPNITQYADTSACSGSAYTYRIRSFKTGVWERLSNTATASTPAPVAPADLAAMAQSESRVMLTWNHGGSDLSGFTIERCSGAGCSDFAPVVAVGPGVRTYFVGGFAPGTYTYRVRAHKDASCPWDSEYSNTSEANTATPSVAGFAITVPDSTSAFASWTDNSTTATGYKLERCTGEGCGSFMEIASLDKDPAALLAFDMEEPGWSGIPDEVMDTSGSNRHGKALNGATTVAGGRLGRAASFDGVNSYMVAGVDGTKLSQWTVEMWIKPDPLSNQKMIFQWGDSPDVDTSTPFLRLNRYNSTSVQWLYTYYNGGTSPYTGMGYTGAVTAPDNQWTHVVLTYNGTRLRAYSNGVLSYSGQMTNIVQTEKALVAAFGAGKGYAVGEHSRYKGLIDGAAMYRRALSPAEVLARYQRGSDLSVCSATTYSYRMKAVNKGLSNAGGGCWSTRAPLTVTNFQPEFQTRVVVPYDPAMKTGFDDVRFYDAASGRELPFWLDTKTDGVSATFWMRTGGSPNIYIYYGNPSATSSSEGRRTFEAFDDFRDSIGNVSAERPYWLETIWSYANDNGYRYITAGSGTVNFSYGSGYTYTWSPTAGGTELLETGIQLGNDFHAQIRLNSYTVNDQTFAGIAVSNTATAYTFGRYRKDATSTNGFRVEKLDGTSGADYASTALPAYLAVKKIGSSYSFFQSSDNANWTMVGGPYSDLTPTRLSLFGKELTDGPSALVFSMDDFLVRKYAAIEPTTSVGPGEPLATCSTLGWDNPYTDPQTVTTPTPGAPSNLALTTYDTEIDLTWSRNTADETGFKIERCQGAGCGNFTQIATVATGVTTYNDVGLVLGTSYTYRIKAYKTASCGWETAYAPTATATTALLAPTVTVASGNTTQTTLSWTDNTRSETIFSVDRCQGAECSDFTPIDAVVGTTFTDSSACFGTTYMYRVNAVSAGLSSGGGGCWQKRKLLTINNFQPNYQVAFTVYNETGMRTDFGDIRFYDATTGRELPYWIESKSDGVYGSALVWLKTGDNNTIYMYFGNPSASSSSNGSAVFEIFDEFNDGTIDTTIWTVLPGSGSISETGGSLAFSYTGSAANDWSATNGRQAAVVRLNSVPAYDFTAVVKLNNYTVPNLTHAGIGLYGSDSAAYLWGRHSGASEDYGLTKLDGTLIGTYSSNYLPEFFAIKKRGPSYSFHSAGSSNALVQKANTNVYNDIPFNGLVLFGKEWGSNNLAFGMDLFYIRKLAAVEPNVYLYGSSEQATICGASWVGPYSTSLQVTTATPAPPTALTAAAVTPTRINLNWAQTSDESGFRIERCSTEGCTDFTEIGTVGADVTTFSDSAVVAGTSYSYRVRGYKATPSCNWSSDYSNIATAIAALAAPAGLTATVVSDTQVNLDWSDTADAGTGFRIERCTGSRCTNFTRIASVNAHTTSYIDNTVTPGNTYTYRVRGWTGALFESGEGCWTKKAYLWVSSGFLPNYQTRITVYYSPTLTPGLNSDFSDIRFFDDATREELPYWIEKVTPGSNGSATATVWVKTGAVTYPNTAGSSIFMYFGNKNASSVSSGTKTFEFFDDFSDGTLGTAWTQLPGNGTITESGGALNFSYDGAVGNDWTAGGRQGTALLLNSLPAGDFVAQIKLNDYLITDQSFAGIGVYGSDTGAYLLGRSRAGNYYFTLQKNDGTQVAVSNSSVSPHYLGIKKMGGQYSFLESTDNSYWPAVGGSYSDIPFNGVVLMGKESGASGVSFSMSQFYIRKAAAAEPSLSVSADRPQSIFVCTDAWEGPYSNEAFATTSGGHVNHAPVITSTPVTTATEDAPYTYQIMATDEDGDQLTYRLIGNPAGMTISGTGLVSWTPDWFAADKPTTAITVAVDDGWGTPATQSFTITVTDVPRPPIIDAIPAQSATANVLFSYRVIATDPDLKPLTYSISSVPAADGLTIGANGTITWLPPTAAAGSYTVTVTVNDGSGSATRTFSLTVAPNNAPVIASSPVTHATAAVAYTYQVAATDQDGDALSYALPIHPTGMTISPQGLISWTPTIAHAGTNPGVAVTVTDATGAAVTQKFNVSVPVITSTPVTVAAAGIPYTYQVAASDPAGTPFTSYALAAAPPWMTIDPATGLISGTPAGTGGTSQVTVRAYLGSSYAAQDFSLSVVSAPTAITATPGNATATFSWTPGAGAVSSLFRYGTASGTYTTTTDPAVSPVTLTGRTNGQTIYFQVGARNAAGTAWSEEYTVTPVAPPSAPTAISATSANGQVTISWTAGINSTSSFIQYGTSSGVYPMSVDPAVSPQTISGLTNGQTIYYRVGARNAGGTALASQLSVAPVGAPTGISATAASGSVTITWTLGTGSTSSIIRYGTTSGNYTTTLTSVTSPRTISSLANGTTIYYQVGAKNTWGTTWSAEYTVTPLAAPSNISATAGSSQGTISWTTGAGATSSAIKYGITSGNLNNSVDPATSPQLISGLTNGQIIYYQVGSKNSYGTVWSGTYNFTPH